MQLNNIILTRFKNYEHSTFNFSERIIGICGMNGKGKTNLLDAIWYLCFTKSYFTSSDLLNVGFGFDGFRLEGLISSSGTEAEKKNDNKEFNVVAIFKGPGRKEFSVNDIAYEKFSSHIGRFPCVMVAPDDIEMIGGGSEQRRKFIDTVLSQMDPEYLQYLINYTKILQQRNSLLKNFAEQKKIDKSLLEVIDEQLVHSGKKIFEKRRSFCEKLFPVVKNFYLQIAANEEMIDLKYESQLQDTAFEELLTRSRERDLISQRSNAGVHKDDISALLKEYSFKSIASQGQRKSLLFALKFAEFELLKQNKGFAPILLLDDVFEKLDDKRMQNLLEWVCVNNHGQVFITDTHFDRLNDSLNSFGIKHQIIELR